MWGLVSFVANRAASAFAFLACCPSRKDAAIAGPARNTVRTARPRAMRRFYRALRVSKIQSHHQHRETFSLDLRLGRLTSDLAAGGVAG